MNKKTKEYLNIEEDFFDIDHEKQMARVVLSYDKVSDIFDHDVITKIPMMTEDFFSSLLWAFDYLPKKYKLDIDIVFNDLEGYSEKDLLEIFEKNLAMEMKARKMMDMRSEGIALSLCALGVAFILISIFVNNMWKEITVGRRIVTYVLDIMATVPFWGAMEVYLVDKNEKRKKAADLIRRFGNIEFKKADNISE